MDLKKTFLVATLASLIVSAGIGIGIFLFGDLGETQSKLLLTALAVAGFSLTGWASVARNSSWWLWPLQPLGAAASVVGLVVVTLSIWELIAKDDQVWQLIATLSLVAFSLGHLSLLSAFRPANLLVRACWLATMAAVLAVAFVLLNGIWGPIHPDNREAFFRILGIVVILDVLGSLVLFPLSKLTGAKSKPKSTSKTAPSGAPGSKLHRKLRPSRQR
ncbi:MAG: hypothetical protein ACE1Y2_06105 [Stenotrophomonas maltophilia]